MADNRGWAQDLPHGNLFTRAGDLFDMLGGPENTADLISQSGWCAILRFEGFGRKTCDCIAAILVHGDMMESPKRHIGSKRVYNDCLNKLQNKEAK